MGRAVIALEYVSSSLCANSLVKARSERNGVPACHTWVQRILLDRVSSTCLANSELIARPGQEDVTQS